MINALVFQFRLSKFIFTSVKRLTGMFSTLPMNIIANVKKHPQPRNPYEGHCRRCAPRTGGCHAATWGRLPAS